MSGVQRFIHPMRCFTAVVGMLSGKYISDSSFLVYERIENVVIIDKDNIQRSLCILVAADGALARGADGGAA